MRLHSIVSVSLLPLVLASCASVPAGPPWQVLASPTTSELRGLSVVSERVAWASGTRGTVLRTVDGRNWQAFSVPGAQALDFRDIHAIDASSAIVMSAGPGDASRIYRSDDGGASWSLITTNAVKEGFWDAIAFWDKDHGLLFGDPVNGRFQTYATADGGRSWTALPGTGLDALPNEGAFAASGSCLSVAGASDAWIVTGGAASSRVFHSSDRGATWRPASLPIPAGAAARGAFSVAFADAKTGMAVGGDYQQKTMAGVNGARSVDGGATWAATQVLPVGYMSVVTPVRGSGSYVAGGLAGSGYSTDGGITWKALDATPVNTIAFASPAVGWAVGPKGLLMRYAGPSLRGN